jgi:hypothetical protein
LEPLEAFEGEERKGEEERIRVEEEAFLLSP